MNAIKERTNKPAWNGLKFIRQAGEHYHADLLTDELAISLLKRGFLTEKDFVILPKIEAENKAENQAELNCIAEFKEKLKQGATQEDLFEQYKNVEMIGGKKVTKKYLISLIDKANEA